MKNPPILTSRRSAIAVLLVAAMAGMVLAVSAPGASGNAALTFQDGAETPTNLRFRKSANEVLLLWDAAPADSWVVRVDGEPQPAVFEQRFTVSELLLPHTVTAIVDGQEQAESATLTFYEAADAPTPEPPSTTTTTTSEESTTTGSTASTAVPPTTGGTTTSSTVVPPPTTDPADTDVVLGQDNSPIPEGWSRPVLDDAFVDQTYRTSIRRVTSAEGTRFNRNTYSRRQAENADGSLFLTYHGNAEYRVYDRVTTEQVAILDTDPDAEPQWHPTDPDLIRYLGGDNSYVGDLKLYETSVSSGGETVIADLTDRVQNRFAEAAYMVDRAEGSPSADGNRYAWIVFNGNEQRVGIVSYDLSTDTILGFAEVKPGDKNGAGEGLLDWVSTSPTGDYVVAGYWYGTYVYDADMTNERKINSKADHSDIALDADGNDTYVYIDFSAGTDGGWLVAVDLQTLDRTRLFELYKTKSNTSVHVSGKGYAKPGWVVVSTYNCKVEQGWACDKVMAVEMATQTIVNLAHTQNCGDNYWTETHAVVNRDFSRIYFNSDAGSCGIDAEVYELSVPALP